MRVDGLLGLFIFPRILFEGPDATERRRQVNSRVCGRRHLGLTDRSPGRTSSFSVYPPRWPLVPSPFHLFANNFSTSSTTIREEKSTRNGQRNAPKRAGETRTRRRKKRTKEKDKKEKKTIVFFNIFCSLSAIRAWNSFLHTYCLAVFDSLNCVTHTRRDRLESGEVAIDHLDKWLSKSRVVRSSVNR